MPKDANKWPILRPYRYPSGRVVWMVDCGLLVIEGSKQKRERYFFDSKKEAETKRDLLRIKRNNEGRAAFDLAQGERDDARIAIDLLKPHGVNLRQAAQFYLNNLDVLKSEKLVSDVVAELIAVKQKDGRSDRYVNDIQVRLRGFAAAFPDRHIHEITTPDLEEYLRSLNVGAVSRNNTRRLLVVLFGHAVKCRYALRNPAPETERATVTMEKPGILTILEAKKLLEAASADILPAIAIGLFAGLRPESEIWRLDWSQIDLKGKTIDVSKSKNTSSYRFVDIKPALTAWLKTHAKAKGPVSPIGRAYFRKVQESRETAAGKLEEAGKTAENLRSWPSDCLRHTFASYAYPIWGAERVSEQLGHGGSLQMLHRHYRNRVKLSEARAFWKLSPEL